MKKLGVLLLAASCFLVGFNVEAGEAIDAAGVYSGAGINEAVTANAVLGDDVHFYVNGVKITISETENVQDVISDGTGYPITKDREAAFVCAALFFLLFCIFVNQIYN